MVYVYFDRRETYFINCTRSRAEKPQRFEDWIPVSLKVKGRVAEPNTAGYCASPEPEP
jgi:hypothetical protein